MWLLVGDLVTYGILMHFRKMSMSHATCHELSKLLPKLLVENRFFKGI